MLAGSAKATAAAATSANCAGSRSSSCCLRRRAFQRCWAQLAVAGEYLAERRKAGDPVPGDLEDGFAEFGSVDGLMPGQQVDVGEVPALVARVGVVIAE